MTARAEYEDLIKILILAIAEYPEKHIKAVFDVVSLVEKVPASYLKTQTWIWQCQRHAVLHSGTRDKFAWLGPDSSFMKKLLRK